MRMNLIAAPLVLPIVLGVTSSAIAQTAPSPQPQQAPKPEKDPNEVVCERQQQLGSRLASERVCKTRAEWAEERRMTREDIEKIQTLRDRAH